MQAELTERWEKFNQLREILEASKLYVAGKDLYVTELKFGDYMWLVGNAETLALFAPKANQIKVVSISHSSFCISPNEHLSNCR